MARPLYDCGMTGTNVASFGSWKSPLSPEQVAKGKIYLGQIAVEGDAVYWVEGRPEEEGRNVLMRWTPDGRVINLTAAPFNVRSRVHEYGGGAFWVDGVIVYFVNFKDQRIYRQRPGKEPEPLTPSRLNRLSGRSSSGTGRWSLPRSRCGWGSGRT